MSPSQIAHYRITAKIGEGGMGAVYRATDTKLHRDVAIKIIPEIFAADPDRLARFTREAQVVASLNHPHIAAIYGVEDGALVLELVEGKEPKGPLTPEEALPLIFQFADALEYAHERGVVHRDLKPANLKLTPEGNLKVLDFGLAKALSTGASAAVSDAANSPTLTMRATMAGAIMGTAAYMSPEQARGQHVDKRADIWSFGVVVYELLTGQQLFAGRTVSDILAAVLTREPDLTPVPPRFHKLLRLCLTRDPRQRLRDISAIRLLLEESPPAPAARPHISWLLAGVFALAALALAVTLYRRPAQEPPNLRFAIYPPPKSEGFAYFALSPDGRRLAFVTGTENYELWIRDLDVGTARRLTSASVFASPFWSPDSQFIGFFHEGKLRRIDPNGGLPVAICDAPYPRGGSWNSRGEIIFAPASSGPILRVSSSGGTPTPATRVEQPAEYSHRWPTFLPDGRHFVFLARSSSIDKATLVVGDLESSERHPAAPGISTPAYDPRGFLLLFRDGALRALPWDAVTFRPKGDPIPISEDVEYQPNNSMARFSISQTGMLAWIAGSTTGNMQLHWFDRGGKALEAVGPQGQMGVGAISPDGRFVATDRMNAPASGQGSGQDIWVYDLARGTESRFTFGGRNQFPVWSPDGKFLAYLATQNEKFAVAIKPAAGDGPEQVVYESASPLAPGSWSRDGHSLVLSAFAPATRDDVVVISDPLDAVRRRTAVWLQTPARELSPALSPDGKWLAYTSDEAGANQVYVSSFPGKNSKYQISIAGGMHPFWSGDGKELFYLTNGRVLMASTVTTGARFEFSPPKQLFPTRVIDNSVPAISPDGKRFLLPTIVIPNAEGPINVVTNWRAGVKP